MTRGRQPEVWPPHLGLRRLGGHSLQQARILRKARRVSDAAAAETFVVQDVASLPPKVELAAALLLRLNRRVIALDVDDFPLVFFSMSPGEQ